MKKIRVFELAKEKKLSNAEVILLLKNSGMKKVSAITYVSADVLDKLPTAKNKTAKKVSHIYPESGRKSSLAVKAESIEEAKQEEPEKKKEEKPKQEVKQKPEVEPEAKPKPKKDVKEEPKPLPAAAALQKKPAFRFDILAAVAAAIAILLTGFVYTQQQADKVNIATAEKSIVAVGEQTARIGDAVSANQAAIADINRKVSQAEFFSLERELKSEASILRAMSRNMKPEVKQRIDVLATDLSGL